MSVTRITSLVFYSILLLCSCGQSKSIGDYEYIGDRNLIKTIEVTSIDDNLPEIHAFSYIKIIGDTLIIHDPTSTGHQFIAYDIIQNKYLGSFGSTGNGPGEINNFGCIFIDRDNRILYGVDGNKWHISALHIDSALIDSHYKAYQKTELNSKNGRFPINYANYLNDSTIICSIYVPNDNHTFLSSRLASLSLDTGNTTLIDEQQTDEKKNSCVIVSPLNHLIITADRTHDRIQFFNMNGRLIKSLYGPDYVERYDGRKSFYYSPVICNDNIYI